MDISIFGLKISLEVLILIGVVYLILVGHTVCSCCNFYSKIESFDNGNKPLTPNFPANAAPVGVTAANPLPSSGPSKKPKDAGKESFVGANTNYGESSNFPTKSTYLNTSSWGMPNLVVTPGKPIPKAAQAIIDRPNQQLPLPEGQLSLFDNMPFSPECCPNTYSSSMGCACMNTDTYNYLITRAGNNVPYSEY